MKISNTIIFFLLGFAVYSCTINSKKTNETPIICDGITTGKDSLECRPETSTDDIVTANDSLSEHILIADNGKIIVLRPSFWVKDRKEEFTDTIIHNYRIECHLFATYDSCSWSGPYDMHYRDATYRTDIDTLLYYYGYVADIIIEQLGSDDHNTDTIHITNKILRECAVRGNSDESIYDHPINKHDLVSVLPEYVNDTIRIKLCTNVMDTDYCLLFHYDWTVGGDTLYLGPYPGYDGDYDDYDI